METALIASIAAAASAVAAILSWIAALQARRSHDRNHAWERLTWAVRSHSTRTEHDISRTVLERLRKVRWAPKEDRNLAVRALRRHGFPPPTMHPERTTDESLPPLA